MFHDRITKKILNIIQEENSIAKRGFHVSKNDEQQSKKQNIVLRDNCHTKIGLEPRSNATTGVFEQRGQVPMSHIDYFLCNRQYKDCLVKLIISRVRTIQNFD